jgi:hypothetical protein
MIWLWLFWLEVVFFSAYLLWNLFGVAQERSLTTVQWVNAGLYTVALLWGLYGLVRFAARRWAAK